MGHNSVEVRPLREWLGKWCNRPPVAVIASLVLILVTFFSLLAGVTFYSINDLIIDSDARAIVLKLRLPRVLCAALVGGGLAIVGATYQSIFRNHLASPFTLGVSSGAALAASTAIVSGLASSRYGLDVGAFALFGAIASIFIIVAIDSRRRSRDSSSLLLIGIVFSFFCSSLISLLQFLSDYSKLFQVARWMMGGVPIASWFDLGVGFFVVSVAYLWLRRRARALDLLLFGDDLAVVKGIDVTRVTRVAFVLTSCVVGWVVAQCGVIGFVGIVVPALARMVVGVKHASVLPLAGIFGAILVVLCDLLGRVAIAPFEIPAGVFTAVLGGPIFIFLLLQSSWGRSGQRLF